MMKKLALFVLLMPLAACQSDKLTTPTTKPGSSPLVCVVWVPIYYDSTKDRPRTVAQVRKNNAAQSAYCK